MIGAFDLALRTRVVFGPGTLDRLGELARELGFKRTLVVTDKGLLPTGITERVGHRIGAAAGSLQVEAPVRKQVGQGLLQTRSPRCAAPARRRRRTRRAAPARPRPCGRGSHRARARLRCGPRPAFAAMRPGVLFQHLHEPVHVVFRRCGREARRERSGVADGPCIGDRDLRTPARLHRDALGVRRLT